MCTHTFVTKLMEKTQGNLMKIHWKPHSKLFALWMTFQIVTRKTGIIAFSLLQIYVLVSHSDRLGNELVWIRCRWILLSLLNGIPQQQLQLFYLLSKPRARSYCGAMTFCYFCSYISICLFNLPNATACVSQHCLKLILVCQNFPNTLTICQPLLFI